MRDNPLKYIYPHGTDKWVIKKRIKDKIEYFGIFRSTEDAKEERDELIKADWKYENIE